MTQLAFSASVTLADILTDRDGMRRGPFGSALKKSLFTTSGIKVYAQGNVIGGDFSLGHYYVAHDYFESKLGKFEVMPGDILVTCAGTIGRIAVVPEGIQRGVINQALLRLRINREVVDEKFVVWFLQALFASGDSEKLTQGTALKNLAAVKVLKAVLFPMMPLDAQRSVASQLERTASEIDSVQSRLEAIPDLIAKFRQSVLAAAFRGDLTKEWREQNPDVEPASVLLERIRAERRERWIEDAAEKGRAKAEAKGRRAGKTWTDDDDEKVLAKERAKAAKKYKEPEPVDPTGLPELPDTWCWARWDELSTWVTYGFTRPMPHVEDGPRIVTAKNVRNGYLDFAVCHRTPPADFQELSAKDRPLPGDILITKDGSIGRAAVVPEGEPFCINQSVAVVWLRGCRVDRNYLLGVIEAPLTQRAIQTKKKGNAIQHLSITDFRNLPLPLAPSSEQDIVAGRVTDVRSMVTAQGAAVEELAANLLRLERSILAAAFSPASDE